MDGGMERSPTPQSSRVVSVEVLNRGGDKDIIGAVNVEVIGLDRNDDVCEGVAAVESSNIGAELVSVRDTNCVVSGGEKILASDI
jgi:hypothetical protein